jgi:ATP-binding cassette, subfamily B, bacterial PglK
MKTGLIFTALKLIPKSLRAQGAYIVALVIFATVLDLFSLASFVPVIALILDTDRGLNFLPSAFNSIDATTSVRILTVVALSLIILKTLFNSWVTRKKADYAYRVGQVLAENSLTHYFSTPHNNFTRLDFAREMNRISNAPLTFANNFIIPIGTLFAETIVGGTLFVAAAIYKPAILLLLLLTIIPLGIIYQIIRTGIKTSSERVKSSYPLLLKSTLQSIEGLTEIRVFKKQSFFHKRFAERFKTVAEIFSKDHAIHTATSRITELVAGTCVCAVILFLSFSSVSISELILTLSVYAAISFRMIPSVNRILTSLVQLRTHEHILQDLAAADGSPANFTEEKTERTSFNRSIEFVNISVGYEHDTFLKDVSFTLNKGEQVLLYGKSGTGKTTLLLTILGLVRPTSGEIRIDGRAVNPEDLQRFQNVIGYVPQNPYMLDGSIAQNIAFGLDDDKINFKKAHNLLEQLDLASWVRTLPQGINTSIGENGNRISGGQRQRIAIARALYYDTEILLMDEVTNQLDKATEEDVMKVFNNPLLQEKTIVLVTHRPEIWKSFDTVYELKSGKLDRAVLNEMYST